MHPMRQTVYSCRTERKVLSGLCQTGDQAEKGRIQQKKEAVPWTFLSLKSRINTGAFSTEMKGLEEMSAYPRKQALKLPHISERR